MLDAERDERAARSSRTTSIGASGSRTAVNEAGASKKMQGRGKSEEHKNLVEIAALSQHSWVGGNACKVSLGACKPREERIGSGDVWLIRGRKDKANTSGLCG